VTLNDQFDAVVIGGGPVGCVVALALSRCGLKTAMLEAQADRTTISDGRTLALSWNSFLILNRLDAWSDEMVSFPIRAIHISDRGNFGQSTVSASDLNLTELGFVVRFQDLLPQLRMELIKQNVETFFHTEAKSIKKSGEYSSINLTSKGSDKTISSRLVVMADGGQSLNIAGLKYKKSIEYGHKAIVGIVKSDAKPSNIAYERFTDAGPIALLPRGNEFSFVWSVNSDGVDSLLNETDENFLSRFQKRLWGSVWKFHCNSREAQLYTVYKDCRTTFRRRNSDRWKCFSGITPNRSSGFKFRVQRCMGSCPIMRTNR
jgi:2-octaprenyl-6-methoxyphenol hydroxylase